MSSLVKNSFLALWLLFLGNIVLGQERPNVVLIMADDVSWEAFGCFGAEDYKTPHLDGLASRGMRFTHCYSTPICTTSRVKLMTGQYNFRNYTHFAYLDPEQKTFGHLMQQAGYKTAIAGKWQLNGLANTLPGHLDRKRPYQAGFDEYMLWQLTHGKSVNGGGGERFWSPLLDHNENLLTIEANEGKYGPDMLCDFICDFMDRNHDEPFFVYYPMVLVHDPFVPTPDTIGERSRGHEQNKEKKEDRKENFVAMVNYMDKIVGRIVQKVEELGELDNTIFLFTADNGTNTKIESNWNGRTIKGGKGGMTDMGTHVPLIAYWKGHTPAGQVNDSLIDFTDFYPTLAEVAGQSLTEADPIDGVSFFPQLNGDAGSPRKWVFCHYEPYWNKTPGQFVRNQKYKLYNDGRYFDIGAGDLEEKRSIAASASGKVKKLQQEFSKIMLAAPPTPKGNGSRTTVNRPIYPKWQFINAND